MIKHHIFIEEILKRVDYFPNFVICVIFRRAARDLEMGMARGGTERRVIFMRSYPTDIVLPKLVQAGSDVACHSSLHFLLKRNRKKC